MIEQSKEPDEEIASEAHMTEAQIASRLKYYAPVIGAFKEDPMLDTMMGNIRARKKEMNADDNIT